MNKQAKNYTNEELDLLSGQIQGTRYVEEVQTQLIKMGKVYSDGYITRVFGRFSYNNDIWDAVKAVALARQQKRKDVAADMEQLVEATV